MVRKGLALVALTVAGCGGGGVSTTVAIASTTSTTTTLAVATSAVTVAATTTLAAIDPPVVLGIVSGPGDDLTLEVTAYFDRAPGDTPIVVGIDSDDSYDGTGDPTADLEGGVRSDVVLLVFSDGGPVAAGLPSDVADWVSWSLEDDVLRVYFFQDVAPVTGTLWVHAGDAPGATAGVPIGESCSIRGSALGVTPDADVPDPGLACRYP